MDIYDKEQKKKEMEKAFDEAKSKYRKNIVEPWQNDKFFRMEKNLWIYFLTEPKKILDCIKEVQKKAAERGSSSYKALNIVITKPTWKPKNNSDLSAVSIGSFFYLYYSLVVEFNQVAFNLMYTFCKAPLNETKLSSNVSFKKIFYDSSMLRSKRANMKSTCTSKFYFYWKRN